jgi:sulfite reductase alpha subunit-like flavoprotein
LALGVGISPFLSILEEQYLKGNPQRYKFHLFFGCKDLGDEIKLK